MTTSVPKEPVSLEALASLPTVLGVTASRGGDRLAFYWDKTGRFELYVLDLRTRDVRRVTNGEAPKAPRAGFVWTADDAGLVFSKDRDGDERQAMFLVDLASGEVRALDHAPQAMDYVHDAHPDGARLLVGSTREGQMAAYAHDPRADAETWTRLTSFGAPVFPGEISPDGTRFSFVTNETADFKNRDGYVANMDGSNVRRVFSRAVGSQDTLGAWHPGGQIVAVRTDADGTERVGLLDVASGEVRMLSTGPDDESPGGFSPDGRLLSVTRNREASLMPVLYDIETGEERVLALPPGVAQVGRFVLGGEKLVVTHATSNRRADVLLYDLATDTFEVLLPAEYGELDASVFVEAESVWYESFDGRRVQALLHRPRGDGPFAALVHVHGGPTAQFFRGFDLLAQFLVTRGFAVLSANIRGSTGYGVPWRDENLKDWGGGDLGDVVAGARFLKSLDFVDAGRVGVFGGSFGGYMSYFAAVRAPDEFKVSIPIVGITDLHRLYEDITRVMPQLGYYFRSMMGDPVEDAALWRDRSAVTHAANLKAKMLILHGANDPRCPLSQASGFRDKLLELGRREGTGEDDDFEYHVFQDEGHGPGDIAGKIREYRLLADFLTRRL